MGAIGWHVKFTGPPPAAEALTARFQELTGLALSAQQYGSNLYTLTASPLRSNMEMTIDSVIVLVRFRLYPAYLEWNVLRCLQTLGGQVPQRIFPRYSKIPWKDLSWYRRWRHR